jgi:hypothetical protein
LRLLLSAYGFEIESMYDWKSRLAGHSPPEGLATYARGERATLRCRWHAAALSTQGQTATNVPVYAGPARQAPGQLSTRPQRPLPTGGRWRARANKALATVTGYELRRATSNGS